MPLSIKIAEANFTKIVARAIPYEEDLTHFYLLGGTEADSLKNLVNNSSATKVGTPVFGENYMETTAYNGMKTADLLLSNVTMICVSALSVNSVACGHINYNSTKPGESSATFYDIGATTAPYFRHSALMASSGPIQTGFRYFCGAVDASAAELYYYGGDGTLYDNTASRAAAVLGGNFFRVGAHATEAGSLGGTVRTAAVMRYNRKLTDDEAADVHEYLKLVMANRGIVLP